MMKRAAIFLTVLFFATSFTTSPVIAGNERDEAAFSAQPKVVVYYFHLSRRCVTCRTVEEKTRKAVEELYPSQVKSGEYKFMAINIEEDGNEAIAKKAGVSGQALVVICNDKKSDITDKAFLYANDYEKIKELVKTTVGKVLN